MSSHASEPADPPGEAGPRGLPPVSSAPPGAEGPVPPLPSPPAAAPGSEPRLEGDSVAAAPDGRPPAPPAASVPYGGPPATRALGGGGAGGAAPPSAPSAIGEPAWAAWQGLLGLFAWVVGTFIVGSVVVVAAAAAGLATLDTDKMPPGVLIAATVAGNVVFIAVPLAFAAITARPRLWHFGLRRTRFWPTLGWALVALFVWFVFSAVYEAVVDPPGRQSTADDLGVNRSTTLLIVGGFVVIVLAPIVEEFFFRGFIYRTLRNGLAGRLGLRGGVILAAVLDGLLFGAIHATNTPVAILPVLAVLGTAFCLVYERTGSLFAVIALHAVVNTLGYLGVAKNSAPVALGFGTAMILACILVPRFLGRGRPPAEAVAAA